MLPLTIALNRYDHVRDAVDGRVPVEGVDATWLTFGVEEIFFRFSRHREWDVSELSLGKYVSLRAGGDDSLIAIPVFPSRVFRHSAVFVRPDSPLRELGELAGTRVGLPEWTQTATVWVRGLLAHDHGVALSDVEWVQGGVNEPGREEGIPVSVPDGVSLTPEAERSLADLLLAGELDAVVSAHPPDAYERGELVRLVRDSAAVEAAHHARTGVFPIMHTVAIRREVYDANPWVAMNLVTALTRAKDASVARLADPNASMVPLPLGHHRMAEAQAAFGTDPWPYGLEPNRRTLETFLGYADEQGVAARRLAPEELFAPETLSSYRV